MSCGLVPDMEVQAQALTEIKKLCLVQNTNETQSGVRMIEFC